jgi:hypothetical protein
MPNPDGRPRGAKNKITTRLPFRTAEVMRAIRGARNMGLSVTRIEIIPSTGTITVVTGAPLSDAEKAVLG